MASPKNQNSNAKSMLSLGSLKNHALSSSTAPASSVSIPRQSSVLMTRSSKASFQSYVSLAENKCHWSAASLARMRPSTPYLASVESQCFSMAPYDLKTLNHECLVELIRLLNKCLCIWHNPTRKTSSRKERRQAYQLLMKKLRDYQPDATFWDTRSIVRQLISGFFNYAKMSNMTSEEQDKGNNSTKLDARLSRTILEELIFLINVDTDDELDINKFCSFCILDFYTNDALWNHMISQHLAPQHAAGAETTLSSASTSKSRSRVAKTSKSRRRISSTSKSRSRIKSHGKSPRRTRKKYSRNTENDTTDFATDCLASDWEVQPLRRSRRKKRTVQHTNQSGPRTKRTRRLRDLDNGSNGDTDSSAPKTKPSTYYLREYEDKFLENFIALYRQHECLWQENSADFKNRKLRAAAYDALSLMYRRERNTPTASITKIKQLIRRMRYYYEGLKKPNASRYRSNIWQQLAFIENNKRLPTHEPITIECTKCSKRFKRSKVYQTHILKVHPPTECNDCKENFDNADDLKKHLLWYHRKDQQCPMCHAAQPDWTTSLHLSEHFFDHVCPTCSQVFHDSLNFKRHKNRCRSRRRFRCWHCEAVFGGTQDFKRHSKTLHQDDRPFKCDDCEISFKYLAPLSKHRRVHKRLEQVK